MEKDDCESTNQILSEINSLFTTRKWFDFSLLKYEKNNLIICASEDLCYYHELEICFVDAFYFQGPMDWKCTPENGILRVIDKNDKIYKTKRIEGPSVGFSFNNDDEDEIFIFAKQIIFNTDTVFYYPRDNLKPGERIADWVKSAR